MALRIVSGNESGNTLLIVRNILGQEVYHKNHTAADCIDLALDGAAGVYSVEIADGEKRVILKVIRKYPDTPVILTPFKDCRLAAPELVYPELVEGKGRLQIEKRRFGHPGRLCYKNLCTSE